MILAIDNLFGLPAHPLIVHLPVFLVPLTAAGAIWCAVSSTWRAKIGWLVVGLSLVSLVSIQLAMSSGESLQHRVDRDPLVERHAQLADAMRPLEAGVLVLAAGMMLVDRRRRRGGAASWTKPVVIGLAALTAVTGVASVVQVGRVGHSGARSVWHDTPKARPGVGGG